MESKRKSTLYSCSGCSNVAQLANKIAVKLDREKMATMSCIAGLGGDVPSLVQQAKRAEHILVIDGCPLQCALHCLKRHGLIPDEHVILTEYHLNKNKHCDFGEDEYLRVYAEISKKII
ncbi:MAG: putative zinc-binding protein [Bacteriovorax sp.]|nr:putative zinc-binding protein [Bacteriovorax sp.]